MAIFVNARCLPPQLIPGDYFPGIEVDAPGVYGKQHAGGTLKIVFPRKC